MKIASCFACIVLATIKTEAGEIFTDDSRQPVELRSTDDVRATNMSVVTMSADTNVPDTIAADTTSRIVEYPKWNVGTNLLEWAGVMPDLKYTTWAATLNAEAYFAKRYSLKLSAAYSDHDYSGDTYLAPGDRREPGVHCKPSQSCSAATHVCAIISQLRSHPPPPPPPLH